MKRTFNIENNNLFIGLLPKDVRDQIRCDLELHAMKYNEELLIDSVTGNYLAMSDRFCWIEDIYH